MQKNSRSYGVVVLFVGVALIITGFFLLIPEKNQGDVFWLDLSVLCLVYFVNIVNAFGFIGFHNKFDKQVAGLGIRSLFILLYSTYTIAVGLAGLYYGLEFRYQLYLQLIGLFLLTLTVVITRISTENAASVELEQGDLRKGKEGILVAIDQFEHLFINAPDRWIEEKRKVDCIKESVRYLSPSNDRNAIAMDIEIANEIKRAFALASNEFAKSDTEVISIILDKCDNLVKLRKNSYSN